MTVRAKVLIIGDSISIGYTPHVARELEGEFAVVHHEGNGGDSQNVLARLDEWLAADADAQLVHVNAGLHDCRFWRDRQACQVPVESYRTNLAEIVRRLRATGKALVWATITPVVEAGTTRPDLEFFRYNETVARYNAAAREIMDAAGVSVSDLHLALIEAGPARLVSADGVHMTDEGYALLGRAVARAVRDHFPA